ncbi:MAG TPA: methyltransferase domain-containing protein [Anaerolineales bacterium]|nr:methyltransferase domain-containing protein [Anaerolineales bacterium]HNQ96116.1 methyltransferase domain-containing protein [Anaerolineales bacterium]HNS61576.1 methyltransferase domain-containing protein [Anaerolineales bacterium]
MVTDEIWKLPAIVNRFLSYRAAIPLAQEQISVMMSILKTRKQPIQRFLDLGCGDGILGAAILGEYPSARGVFVDFSESMLELAREGLKEYADQLAFENLDYGDQAWVNRIDSKGPFDAVVSGYSIHHQPDSRKRQIYEEIFSLLKPDGWFVNIEHIAAESQLAVDLFNRHVIDGRYSIEKASGGTKTRQEISDIFMNRPDKDANILLSVNAQCDWLREIGYEEVDCYFRIYELAVFGGRKPNLKS